MMLGTPAAGDACAVVPPRPPGWPRGDQERETERPCQGVRFGIDIVVAADAVDRERRQRLHHVAAVEIDQRVGRRDHGAEDGVVHHLGEGPFGIARKEAVRILAVDRADER